MTYRRLAVVTVAVIACRGVAAEDKALLPVEARKKVGEKSRSR